ncbi:ABC transporter permease [Campylobacter sp. Cr9]|uniref:ABC transporter permease n=1 Tax=Campylobacter sp. Cr9 TaxID=2735728 RepID=UPI003015845A|nr:ABC transporter permease [Campylobacter sp. Cr9]
MIYFIKKALSFVLLSLILSFVLFCLIYYTNGSAVYANKSILLSKSFIDNELKRLGLNEGLFYQYFQFLKGLISLDLKSLTSDKNIFLLIKERLFNSIVLIFGGGFLMLVFGILLGLISALMNKSLIDKSINFVLMLCFCLPSFYMGILLILTFSIWLELFPSSLSNDIQNPTFLNYLHHLILPLSALILSGLGILVSFCKNTFIQTLNKPYINAAFLMGFKRRRVYFFIIYDAFSSIFGYFSANFIGLLGSSYIIEKVFSYSGIGSLFIDSLIFKDYPLSLVLIIVSFFIVSFFNFLALFLEKIIFAKKEAL